MGSQFSFQDVVLIGLSGVTRQKQRALKVVVRPVAFHHLLNIRERFEQIANQQRRLTFHRLSGRLEKRERPFLASSGRPVEPLQPSA
ncbi:hypothetical protein M2318_001279 [Metapseudomonas resinovorans]|uniref:hypothetical protein n=1 Tax=Metapseudomonas resinovorans TaxID=53412 RepID=UPI003D1A86A8